MLAEAALLGGLVAAFAAQGLSAGLRIALGVLAVFIYAHRDVLLALWRYRGIPGPFIWPVVGNLPEALSVGMHNYYIKATKQYGPAFRFNFGTAAPLVVFSDIDLVREVGLRKFSAFTNHQPPPASVFKTAPKSVKTISQFGLFGSKDTYWKGLRSTFNNIFHQQDKLSGFMPGMKLCAEELADRLDLVQSDEVVDIWRILGKMTLDVVGATVFGVKFKALQDAGQGKAAKATEIFFASAAFGALKNPYNLALLFLPAVFHPLLIACQRSFPHQMDKDMKWAMDYLCDIVETMVERSQPSEQEGGEAGRAAAAEAPAGMNLEFTGEDNFIKLMSHAVNRESGKKLTKDEIIGNTFLLILAGYETTVSFE